MIKLEKLEDGLIHYYSTNDEPVNFFLLEREVNKMNKNKIYGKVSSEDFDKIYEYYISIKYNYDIPKIRNMMYDYTITHSSIGYNYVDGLETLEEYTNKVNKLIDKIVTKYEDDEE
jgi:hypothetical protein